ncbi:hypothetical protein JCM10908_003050 [Rhodotorula pacifica]|uniref:uncharacterized protein n=1 Tax=Rhodotorula pacifica TaxID=1495444 RepID=UPI00318168C4
MAFSPALGSTILLPAASLEGQKQQQARIYFTYSADARGESGAVPEVWTNLPRDSATTTASGTEPQWHAIQLVPLNDDEAPSSSLALGAVVRTGSVPAPTKPGEFEYTYRFRDLKTGELEWLGSADGNGKIRVVAGSESSSAEWSGPSLSSAAGGGEWTRLGGQAAVRTFRFKTEGGEGKEVFEIGEEVIPKEWREDGAVEGIVWEQSNPAWLAPRHLTGSNPLESLSSDYPAQLLLLRARPTAEHLQYRYLVLFPFSTSRVCSYLRGSGSSGKVQLRCEIDANANQPDQPATAAKGHLAVAWGSQGHLGEVIRLAVAAARAFQTGEKVDDLLAAAEDESKDLNEPRPLGLCTWNALSGGGSTSEEYTASSILDWLDGLLSGPGGKRHDRAAGAVKTVLLDDGWQDVSTYVDFDEPVEDSHANRKALKSFQCRREWYDLDEEEGGEANAEQEVTQQQEEEEARLAAAAQTGKKPSFSADSGYEGSPDAVRQLRELDDEAREGTCYELRDVVRRIKAKGIERVGVWMTLCGYWDGLHPESALSDTYTLRRVTLRSPVDSSDQGHLYLPVLADLRAYYTDYFTSLHAAGIDFVKVDDQSKIDLFFEQEVGEDEEDGAQPEDVGDLRQAMLSEMRAAVDRIFGPQQDSVIHCMAGSPRIWGGDLAVLGAKCGRSIIRNSDDYYPDEVDSHRWHVALNSVTNLLSSALRFVPDLDMAQGTHPYADVHVPFRAFSSAPVYATDVESLEGWSRLVATTRVGPRVLQNRSPGVNGTMLGHRLWDDVVGQSGNDNSAALKVGVPVPSALGAHLGIWNCSTAESLSTVVDTSDVGAALGPVLPAFPDAVRSVLLSDADGTSVKEIELRELKNSTIQPQCFARPVRTVDVGQKESKVFSVAPLFTINQAGDASSTRPVSIACVGLLGKIAGLAAIRTVRLGSSAPGVKSETSALAQGSEGATSSSTPSNSGGSSPSPPPATRTDRSQTSNRTFPTPQGRLPFLLAYFAGFFRHASASATEGVSTTSTRTPRSELSGMAREFLRSPIRTFFNEIRALVTFSYAAIVWAASNNGSTTASSSGTLPAPLSSSAAGPTGSSAQTALEVEIDYVSDRLGFYYSGSVEQQQLHFLLDGEVVDFALVRTNEQVPNLVEVDIETAVERHKQKNATGSQVDGITKQKPWVVAVQLKQK